MGLKKKRRLRASALAFLLITAMVCTTGCASFNNFKATFFDGEQEQLDTVKIGVYEPLTGADAKAAAAEVQGIELAHSLHPTVLGKNVELVYADNKSDIHVAGEVIQDLIQRSPAVVLGSYGSVYSLAAVSYLEEAEIPAISVTGSNPIVTDSNPYYFSISYTDTYEGVAMAKYAYEQLGITSAATLKPKNSDFADALVKSFAEKMMQLSGDITIVKASETYKAGADDFSSQLKAIKDSGAQAVFLSAKIGDAVNIMKQAKDLGLSIIFMGTSQWDSEQFTALGKEAVEGAVFPAAFDADGRTSDTADEFLAAYREKYGQDASPASEVAMGFDAYMLALDAIERAANEDDGNLIREALQNTAQYPGASGSITFDASGAPIKSVAIKSVAGGEIKSKYTVEPKWTVYEAEPEETM